MAIDLVLAPKSKRPAGEPCCEPVVYPDVQRAHAIRIAAVAKALGALTHDEYERHLTDAGLSGIEIVETHRVHTHASSAIVRARLDGALTAP
jgi:hypothetical protein